MLDRFVGNAVEQMLPLRRVQHQQVAHLPHLQRSVHLALPDGCGGIQRSRDERLVHAQPEQNAPQLRLTRRPDAHIHNERHRHAVRVRVEVRRHRHRHARLDHFPRRRRREVHDPPTPQRRAPRLRRGGQQNGHRSPLRHSPNALRADLLQVARWEIPAGTTSCRARRGERPFRRRESRLARRRGS